MTSTETHKAELHAKGMNRRITGQGMTEYIIIVALIAISAIAVVGFFGDVVKNQFAGMAQVLGGETKDTDLDTAVAGAGDAGKAPGSLATFGEE